MFHELGLAGKKAVLHEARLRRCILSCLGCFTLAKDHRKTFQKPLQVHALLTLSRVRSLRLLEGGDV